MGATLMKSNPITGGIQEEYEFNLQQAKLTEKDALYNAAQRRKEGARLMKEQVAAYGASGVELEGTPLNVIESDQKDAELEAMNIVYSGKRNAAMMRKQAGLKRTNALVSLGTQAAMMALSGGAGKAAAGGGTTMKNGGAFASSSTGTNGYTISGGGVPRSGEMIS